MIRAARRAYRFPVLRQLPQRVRVITSRFERFIHMRAGTQNTTCVCVYVCLCASARLHAIMVIIIIVRTIILRQSVYAHDASQTDLTS